MLVGLKNDSKADMNVLPPWKRGRIWGYGAASFGRRLLGINGTANVSNWIWSLAMPLLVHHRVDADERSKSNVVRSPGLMARQIF
jgi:hypothetical protein